MLKIFKTLGALACGFALTAVAHGQASPTATARTAFQVGAEYTYARPDYGQKGIQGVSFFGDYDFGMHLGVEAEYHYVSVVTPLDLGENSFFVGPRVILPKGRFRMYGKGMVGIGDFVVQNQANNFGTVGGTNFAFAVGGGVDYLATRHITVRPFDFEYQHWNYLTGLTPLTYSAGVAYRFH